VALLATWAGLPALVCDPHRGRRLLRWLGLGRLPLARNISLLLGKQLVLELEVGLALDKGLPWFPGRIIKREPLPLHEDLPSTMLDACPPHLSRSQDHPAIVNERQWRRGRRGSPWKGFSNPTWKTSWRRDPSGCCRR